MLEQEGERPSVKVLVVISREKPLLRVFCSIPTSMPKPRKILLFKRFLPLATVVFSIIFKQSDVIF